MPTADSEEVASTAIAMALFTIVPLMVGSAGNPLGPVGLLPLLPPPHPVRAAASAASDAVWRE